MSSFKSRSWFGGCRILRGHKIEFPLLADPDSEIIRAYSVLNGKATGFSKGWRFRGILYWSGWVDPGEILRDRLHRPLYGEQLLLKIFPQLVEARASGDQPAHLLTLLQSDRVVIPAAVLLLRRGRVPRMRMSMLRCEELQIHPNDPGSYSELKLDEPQYPKSKVLFLPSFRSRCRFSMASFGFLKTPWSPRATNLLRRSAQADSFGTWNVTLSSV